MVTLEEYRDRRQRLMRRLQEATGVRDPVVIVQGAPQPSAHTRFRQTNDLMYLCPIETPHAYLTMHYRGDTLRTFLFLHHQPARLIEWEGEHLSAANPEAVMAATGVDAVHVLHDLAAYLDGKRRVFIPLRPGEGSLESWNTVQAARAGMASDPWDGRPERAARFAELIRRRYPAIEILDLAPHLDALRSVKSPAEAELMRRAGKLAALGLVEAMRATRPGGNEYQLDAACRFAYLDHGAFDVSYRAVAAGGTNAWLYHYAANDAELEDGDLVLFDCGPDYQYYASDITRMWPVNGTYSPEQRQLYGFMLQYHFALLERLRPGVSAEDVTAETRAHMSRVAESIDWLRPTHAAAAKAALDFPDHLSHEVGMAVHDVGDYRGAPLVAGTVLAVDPQMRVPEEKLYVRVEDTVLITDDGCEVLTTGAPYDMDEVEAIMREARLTPAGPYRRLWD